MNLARFWVVVLSLVVVWAICVAVIISPFIESGWIRKMMSMTFGIGLVVAVGLGGRAIWGRPRAALWPIFIVAAIAAPFVVFAHAFGNFNLFSLLFHIEFGTEGANLSGLGDSVGVAILGTGFFAASAYWFDNLVRPSKHVILAILAVIIAINPGVRFLASYASAAAIEEVLVQELRDPIIVTNPTPPDVIIIYLEGLERGFGDTARFGDAYQVVKDLTPRGLSLTNVDEIAGTDWSIAGLAATLCGLTLLPNGFRFRNNFTGQEAFLTGHTCLPDVLSEQGYALAFLKGTDKTFAGFDHFLGTHGFPEVIDRQAQISRYSAEEFARASSGWAIDDQMLLDTARTEYTALVGQSDPFALFVETIGPHGSTNYFSRNCTADGQSMSSADVAASVDCTLGQVAKFLTFVDENRAGRPTAVILMSDHLNHSPTLARTLPREDRRNTVMLLGLGFDSAVGAAGQTIDKYASMVDVYPTLLTWLGFGDRQVRGGLGVSLFSSEPTLIEQYGLEDFDRKLIPNPELSKEIWEKPLSGATADPA